MAYFNPLEIPVEDSTNFLLRDVAEKIQLSPTSHDIAVNRYGTIHEWLTRPASPLAGVVASMYPQGSMMIGATIASRLATDEFDIDLILELDLPPDAAPATVLDAVYQAIRGEPGSRYHDMVQRQTRCVTVNYADMHLDITPAVRLPRRVERVSHIFHSKPEEPRHRDRRIIANPYGFGRWFEAMTPLEADLVAAMETRKVAEPVPELAPVSEKSRALISLQLIKRWRNVLFDGRPGVRKPPSILLAKLVADAAGTRGGTLADELQRQVVAMIRLLRQLQWAGRLIEVRNPTCEEDMLTDRWPGSLAVQGAFLKDLETFAADLGRLGEATLQDKRVILSALFGEVATTRAFGSFVEAVEKRSAAGRMGYLPGSGSVRIPVAGIIAAPRPVRATPAHSFFGGPLRSPVGS